MITIAKAKIAVSMLKSFHCADKINSIIVTIKPYNFLTIASYREVYKSKAVNTFDS